MKCHAEFLNGTFSLLKNELQRQNFLFMAVSSKCKNQSRKLNERLKPLYYPTVLIGMNNYVHSTFVILDMCVFLVFLFLSEFLLYATYFCDRLVFLFSALKICWFKIRVKAVSCCSSSTKQENRKIILSPLLTCPVMSIDVVQCHKLCLFTAYLSCTRNFPWSFRPKSRWNDGVSGTSKSVPYCLGSALPYETFDPYCIARGILL